MPTLNAIRGTAWLNIFIGAVVIASPWITGETSLTPMYSAVGVGALVALLAAFEVFSTRRQGARGVVGTSTINVLAGIWLVVYATFADATMNYRWLTAFLGLVLVITAGYNVWAGAKQAPGGTKRVA